MTCVYLLKTCKSQEKWWKNTFLCNNPWHHPLNGIQKQRSNNVAPIASEPIPISISRCVCNPLHSLRSSYIVEFPNPEFSSKCWKKLLKTHHHLSFSQSFVSFLAAQEFAHKNMSKITTTSHSDARLRSLGISICHIAWSDGDFSSEILFLVVSRWCWEIIITDIAGSWCGIQDFIVSVCFCQFRGDVSNHVYYKCMYREDRR